MKTIRNFAKTVRRVLTKKHGPLAAWIWGVLAVVGVVLYRRHKAGAGTPGQQDGNNSAYTSPLSPPNLAYEPGGSIPIGPDNSGGGGSSDNAGLLALLAGILAARNGNGKRHPPKNKKKPPKPKNKKKWGGKKVSGGDTFQDHPRSTANLWHNGRAKPGSDKLNQKGVNSGGGWNKRGNPSGKHTYKAQLRERPKVPVVGPQPTATQRPVPSHTRAVRDTAQPAPRPSAPPRRTVRRVGR